MKKLYKKDFQKIADMIKDAEVRPLFVTYYTTLYKVKLVNSLIYYFKDTNDEFDADKFRKACGIGKEV